VVYGGKNDSFFFVTIWLSCASYDAMNTLYWFMFGSLYGWHIWHYRPRNSVWPTVTTLQGKMIIIKSEDFFNLNSSVLYYW